MVLSLSVKSNVFPAVSVVTSIPFSHWFTFPTRSLSLTLLFYLSLTSSSQSSYISNCVPFFCFLVDCPHSLPPVTISTVLLSFLSSQTPSFAPSRW